jgi:TPR repeat protein
MSAQAGNRRADALIGWLLPDGEGHSHLERALNDYNLTAHYYLLARLTESGEGVSNYGAGLDSLKLLLWAQFKPGDLLYYRFFERVSEDQRDVAYGWIARWHSMDAPWAHFLYGVQFHRKKFGGTPVPDLLAAVRLGYRPAFEYLAEFDIPFDVPDASPALDILRGSRLVKEGNVSEGVELWETSRGLEWSPCYDGLALAVSASEKGEIEGKRIISLLKFYANFGSGPGREILGQLYVEGRLVKKNLAKGLRYLKTAFDDRHYEMHNPQILTEHCLGFYDSSRDE